MASTSSGGSGGASIFTVVGVVFVVLKLLKIPPVAHWSWWWVLSPFWIGLAFGLIILLIIFAAIVIDLRAKKRGNKRWK